MISIARSTQSAACAQSIRVDAGPRHNTCLPNREGGVALLFSRPRSHTTSYSCIAETITNRIDMIIVYTKSGIALTVEAFYDDLYGWRILVGGCAVVPSIDYLYSILEGEV